MSLFIVGNLFFLFLFFFFFLFFSFFCYRSSFCFSGRGCCFCLCYYGLCNFIKVFGNLFCFYIVVLMLLVVLFCL